MRDKTVAEFLKSLGAKQPTPGGGAVSALNGAIAAAQLKMVCEYTKNDEINIKIDFINQKAEAFIGLAEADSEAFNKVSEAYISQDSGQINASLLSAIRPSVDIITNCEELINFCEENLDKFNPKLNADLIVSLANLKASVRSAQAMIRTNAEALKEASPKTIENHVSNCRELLSRVDKLFDKLGV